MKKFVHGLTLLATLFIITFNYLHIDERNTSNTVSVEIVCDEEKSEVNSKLDEIYFSNFSMQALDVLENYTYREYTFMSDYLTQDIFEPPKS